MAVTMTTATATATDDLPPDLRQERTADYRTFEVAGDHYTIGYTMGPSAPMHPVETWRDRETELAYAQACADAVARFHPALLDEFRGYADVCGLTWADVLPHFSNNLPEGVLGGCTTLLCRLPDGHVLAARNHDFLYIRRQRYLCRLSPTGYPATLGARAGFIASCYDGFNSHGLFVALHTVRARIAERVRPGIPPHLIPRILLETCHTAAEATARIREMPYLYPFNYIIADADAMFAVETYPGLVDIRQSESNTLVVTNVYVSSALCPVQGRRDVTAQIERIRWLEARAEEDGVRNADEGWEWAQRLLRDHSAPMCRHQPNQATLWSLVADLTAQRVAYSLGAPCRNEFQEQCWPD
jgi:predicted choloylglycine hydrolase